MSDVQRTAFQRDHEGAVVNLMTLEPGMQVRLAGGVTGEVVANPRDGSWVFVRFLTSENDPSLVGAEELVFADDIEAVV